MEDPRQMSINTELFLKTEKLPFPIFITDVNGKIIYKNKLCEKVFTIRKGRNILQFSDDKAEDAINTAVRSESCAIIPLQNSEFYGLVLVLPYKICDNETVLVCSLAPYSYDFLDVHSEILSDLAELYEYKHCFENQVNTIKKALINKNFAGLEEAYSVLKITLMKLKRLKERLKNKASEMAVYTATNPGVYADKSINLCSFLPSFVNSFNALSGIVGFGVTYMPGEAYSICRANSSRLSALLVYVLAYCLKFAPCAQVSVSVSNINAGSRISFVPRTDFKVSDELLTLDFEYLSTMAAAYGINLEFGNTSDGRRCINMDIARKTGSAVYVSAADDFFDVPSAFILKTLMQALGVNYEKGE